MFAGKSWTRSFGRCLGLFLLFWVVGLGIGGSKALTESNSLVGGGFPPLQTPFIVTGQESGPDIRVFEPSGDRQVNFTPYGPGFVGGIRVATGDVNGDGTPDLIVGTAPGANDSRIKIFSGLDGTLVREFDAFSLFTGVNVAAGDVDGDGKDDIIVGAGSGGAPHVKVFSGQDGAVLQDFMAFDPGFRGGVFVAAGDVSGDGFPDILVGTGPGSLVGVKVFDGQRAGFEVHGFINTDDPISGGVNVATGDFNGDGFADLITGAGAGGGPRVRVLDGVNPTRELASFLAFSPNFTGGVRVAAGDVTGDAILDIVTSPGPGGGPHVRVFSGSSGIPITDFPAYDETFQGGVFVAAGLGPTPTPTPAPSTIVVTNDNDAGPGSLRQAVADIASGGSIRFATVFFSTPRTITLGGTEIFLDKDMSILGTGAENVTVSAANMSRVFRVTAVVRIVGLTITGGNSSLISNGSGISNVGRLLIQRCHITGNHGTFGGGISNSGVGLTTVEFSAITNNTSATRGGGIDSTGMLTIVNSTISGNTSMDVNGSGGGGVWARSAGILNSTITNNMASGPNSAGGVYNDTGSVVLTSSIIAKNVNNATIPDVFANVGADFSSTGFNLIGNRGTLVFAGNADQSGDGTNPLDPRVGPLQNNDGETPNHALLVSSPAFDAGISSGYTTDQRGTGFMRVVDLAIPNASGGDGADIGSYEAQNEPGPAFATLSGSVVSPTGQVLRNLRVTLIDSEGGRIVTSTSSFGAFSFANVPTGQTYTMTATSKRYRFSPQLLTVNNNVNNITFTGLE